jgi:nitrogen fixation protein FixH
MINSVFRFLFGYPAVAYAEGQWSLLTGWPRWLLGLAIVAGGVALGWQLYRRGMLDAGRARVRGAIVLGLQTAMLALLLVLLWRPALVVTAVAPRQNIAAILVDDSASMGLETPPRLDRVKEVFGPHTGLVRKLADKFQVRMYSFSDAATRIPSTEGMKAGGHGTHLDEAVRGVLNELEGLPLGAVVVVSDGADNSPPPRVSRSSAIAELKARRVPLHAVGVGRTAFDRDIQVNDVTVPGRVAAGGIVSAAVSLRQEGFAGKTVQLEVRENNTLLQAVPVSFDRPAQSMAVRVNFTPRSRGVKNFTFAVALERDEAIRENNSQSRAIQVDDSKHRLLYLEGEPRWEYKFIRRAVEDDKAIILHSLLRTSANKFYRQGVETEKVLEAGFPKQDELFSYQGLILGSIEAGFFSREETQNIYDFVSRRGGGLLLLGGRQALSDGGYQNTPLADLVPVLLPAAGPTFHRKEARAQLTPYGFDHPMLQMASDARKNEARWKALPVLGDYQRTGPAKPGAVVLAQVSAPGDPAPWPLLVTQRFGRGRSFLFATGSSWRWQMEMDHKDDSHELIWRQLLRGLVADTPGPVMISTDRPLYRDDRRVELRAEVRDEKFQPVENAGVTATITAPDGSRHEVPLQWSPRDEGAYTAEWEAAGAGTFAVELVAHRPGDEGALPLQAITYFQRTEGTLEFYDAQQNRALLSRLAEETGGRYYTLEEARALPEEIVYSKGGITQRDVHELWKIPAVFLALLTLKGTEWGLRKLWGTV